VIKLGNIGSIRFRSQHFEGCEVSFVAHLLERGRVTLRIVRFAGHGTIASRIGPRPKHQTHPFFAAGITEITKR